MGCRPAPRQSIRGRSRRVDWSTACWFVLISAHVRAPACLLRATAYAISAPSSPPSQSHCSSRSNKPTIVSHAVQSYYMTRAEAEYNERRRLMRQLSKLSTHVLNGSLHPGAAAAEASASTCVGTRPWRLCRSCWQPWEGWYMTPTP